VKARILMFYVAVILIGGLLGGTTMALFTDVESNSGNVFVVGSVDIRVDRNLGDPIPGPMFYTNLAEGTTPGGGVPLNPTGLWAPGDTESRNLDVRNMGSLEVRLHQVSAQITSVNGSPPEQMPALAASFANNMNVKIYVAGHPNAKVLYHGSLAALLAGPQGCLYRPLIAPNLGPWPPMVQLVYEVTMNLSAGNDLQGIVPIVSFHVFAEQTANNP